METNNFLALAYADYCESKKEINENPLDYVSWLELEVYSLQLHIQSLEEFYNK